MPLEASDLESSAIAVVRWRRGAMVVLEIGGDVGIVSLVGINCRRFTVSYHIETWIVNLDSEHRCEFCQRLETGERQKRHFRFHIRA